MAGHTNGAIGVKAAHPDRTVVVGCGDGCYNLSRFELMTAVEHDLPVIWVIFDDREFKLIKIFQFATYQETGLVEFQNPDYAAYAEACGADGYTAETLEEFEDLLRRGARLRPAVGHRRPHHPLGDPALQPVTRRCHPRSGEDDRGKVPVLMSEHLSRSATSTQPAASSGGACRHRWSEYLPGGSPEAERAEFARARATHHGAPRPRAQKKASAPRRPARRRPRTLHAKATLAARRRRAAVPRRPAEDLRHGFAQPGAAYRTIVRFSNAADSGEPDFKPDLRGIALRVQVDDEHVARPADDQLPGFARPQCPPVRRVRERHRGWCRSRRSPASRVWSACSEPARPSGCCATSLTARRNQPGSVSPRPTGAAARCAGGPTWRCGICCARRRGTPRRTRRRPTRPTCRPRPPGACAAAISASSCVSSATSTTRPRHRSKTPPSSGPSRPLPPSRSRS